jgi:hypothetical protein
MATLEFALLLAATWIVAGNWVCAIIGFWNKWHGIDRSASLVPAVSAILVALAWLIGPRDGRHWIFIIPAVDIGCWVVLWLPFWLMLGGEKRCEALTATDQNGGSIAGSKDSEPMNESQS